MSINPVSDIVLDVARAADPAKARIAAERLSRGESASVHASPRFDHLLAHSAAKPAVAATPTGFGPDFCRRPLRLPDARTKAYKGLEQLIFKNLVETMLPSGPAAYFGSGTAGDIWRALLADELAAEIGRAIDLSDVHRQGAAMPHPAQTSLPAQTATAARLSSA